MINHNEVNGWVKATALSDPDFRAYLISLATADYAQILGAEVYAREVQEGIRAMFDYSLSQEKRKIIMTEFVNFLEDWDERNG